MTFTNLTMQEISVLDVTQIDPAEFATLNNMQLLVFTPIQLNAMTAAQKQAYDTALANAN